MGGGTGTGIVPENCDRDNIVLQNPAISAKYQELLNEIEKTYSPGDVFAYSVSQRRQIKLKFYEVRDSRIVLKNAHNEETSLSLGDFIQMTHIPSPPFSRTKESRLAKKAAD